MRTILAILSLCGALAAQQGANQIPRYQVSYTASLTSAAAVLTVQQQASGQKQFIGEWASVYCSVACSFTIEQNGAAATSTAATINALNYSPPTTMKAWSTSNVGTGAYVSTTYEVGAGQTFTVDLSRMYFNRNGGTGQNLSIRTSSITGTAIPTIQWVEQ